MALAPGARRRLSGSSRPRGRLEKRRRPRQRHERDRGSDPPPPRRRRPDRPESQRFLAVPARAGSSSGVSTSSPDVVRETQRVFEYRVLLSRNQRRGKQTRVRFRGQGKGRVNSWSVALVDENVGELDVACPANLEGVRL